MDERLKEAIGKVLEIKAEYEELRRTGYQDELFARELKGSEISLIAKEGLFSEDEAIRGSSAIAISYAPTANHLIFTREHLDLILEASKNPELAEPCLYAAETLAEKRPDIFEKQFLFKRLLRQSTGVQHASYRKNFLCFGFCLQWYY